MRRLALACLTTLLTACAPLHGHDGTAADVGSTALALSQGLSEANPIALPALPLRLALVEHAKSLPPEQGVPIIESSRAAGWGFGAHNIAMLLAPELAPVIGLVAWIAVWHQSAEEREFLRICAWLKSQNPEVTTCKYTPSA